MKMRRKMPSDWLWFFASQVLKSRDDVKLIIFITVSRPFQIRYLTVFQFRVVAPTDSAFSKRRLGELGVAIPTRAVKVDFLSANAKPIWFR